MFRRWWRQNKINRAHVRALRKFCKLDGKPHEWAWDWKAMEHPASQYPAYVTPFGDRQRCKRCDATRMINQPSR